MQDRVLSYFKILKEKKRLGNSYLFIGDNFPVVKKVIKLVLCQEAEGFCNSCWHCQAIEREFHPDLFIVSPTNLTIRIESIREIIRFLSLKSFSAERKVVVLKGAEALGLEAGNAFLKTLEEPPKGSFIVLCASKLEALLPTVVSRTCRIFLVEEQRRDPLDLERVCSFLAERPIVFSNRQSFSFFLWTLILFFRDYLLDKLKINNRLLKDKDYAIISSLLKKAYEVQDVLVILKRLLEIYNVYTNVNERLALHLLKRELK